MGEATKPQHFGSSIATCKLSSPALFLFQIFSLPFRLYVKNNGPRISGPIPEGPDIITEFPCSDDAEHAEHSSVSGLR